MTRQGDVDMFGWAVISNSQHIEYSRRDIGYTQEPLRMSKAETYALGEIYERQVGNITKSVRNNFNSHEIKCVIT